MDSRQSAIDTVNRRQFLARAGIGLGSIAAASMVESRVVSALSRKPTARSVIYLHMAGSPPQLDLFDYKPELQKRSGELCPKEFIEGRRLAFIKGHPRLLGSPHTFRPMGGNGLNVCELMPHFERVVDKVTMIRSMTTDQFNHAPAQLLLHTGSAQFGGASMGSWVSWGLGSMNQDLPTFCVMGSGNTDPSGGKSLWGSGYLPSHHQGVRLRGRGDPVLYISNPDGTSRADRRDALDVLARLNTLEADAVGDPETRARMEQFELAYRMQASVPGVMDIAREPKGVRDLYGAVPGQASFANNCLLARRLVERGVRFVQLYDWGWDIHGTGANDDLITQFPKKCLQTDRPIAALLEDLDRRGLLDETLVVWGGEFGRTSMNEKRGGSKFLGRDHHPDCFTMWMAGGGAARGRVFGETDELGYGVHQGEVTVRDLQATILHLLGLDAHKLRYPYQGLEQRLIGPGGEGRVRHELIA